MAEHEPAPDPELRQRAEEYLREVEAAADRFDVNTVVSYNLRAIRERSGLTQQAVAESLALLTGRQLPQASISAMERAIAGERRRRFDAHEIYLFSRVFGVPIVYFFLPPPELYDASLAGTRNPINTLYAALIGVGDQLIPVDQRLAQLGNIHPEEAGQALAALYDIEVPLGWYEHYRTWRKKRLLTLELAFGDQLDALGDFLRGFSEQLRELGPKEFLQRMATRDRGEPLPDDTEPLEE
jgi:transcriptional regulator with XRE-family HTH domain